MSAGGAMADGSTSVSAGGATVSTATSTAGLSSQPFDTRLVPEYDGTKDVVEWWERARLLCELRGVPLMTVVPLRLSGGAFAVWSQMPAAARGSLAEVEKTLYAAFAMDGFAAYDAFCCRRLRDGESPDVFLSDLRRLAVLFGGVSDKALVCAFVSGLPDSARQLIRAGSRAEILTLQDVLARARSVLSDQQLAAAPMAAPAAAMAAPASRAPPTADPVADPVAAAAATRAAEGRSRAVEDRSLRPAAPGPWRREGRTGQGQPPLATRGPRRCWICGATGHISVGCPQRQRPENSTGEAASSPAFSPGRQ